MSILFIIGIFFISVLITEFIRKMAIKKKLIDIPNVRSSHKKPTPRGGGLGIALIFIFIFTATWHGVIPSTNQLQEALPGITAGAVMVSLIGLLDDIRHISAKWRLVVHFMAAIVVLYFIRNYPVLQFYNFPIQLNEYWIPVLAIGLVWMINLFNFMDGIDGLAASEFVFILISVLIFHLIKGTNENVLFLMLCIACTSGFLLWNWPVARIFLGDVGSGFFGIITGAFLLVIPEEPIINMWSIMILASVFLVDSMYTLVRRIFKNHKIHIAHRSHAYQILTRRYKSHLKVLLSIQAINILWLLPIAWTASIYPKFGIILFFIAIIPLIVVAAAVGAGLKND